MKYFSLIVIVLFLGSKPIYSQTVESITFDSKKGEYIIQYRLNDDILRKGFYVPANGVQPFVTASVTYDSVSEYFIYSFEVENKEKAFHPLFSFALKIGSLVTNIESPDNQWWGRYIGWTSKCRWSKTEGFIPGIPPGKSENGFQFSSQSPPAILSGFASSLTDTYFPDIDEELPYQISIVIDSLREANKPVEFKTIGPRKLPDSISNTALLDTLHSYLTFSCSTSWIKNKGICRSLEAKLDNVDRQIDQSTQAAANSLQAFLHELNALKEKQLSSEAYGLLYYNGKFLLERLEG